MSATFGTWISTRLFGEKVGGDDAGNVYYRERKTKTGRRQRRWVIYAGLVISASGILSAIYYIISYLFGTPPPGWTTLVVVNLFLGGTIIISVGAVGLYVAKIFEYTKGRPLYVIDRQIRGQAERD